MVSMISRGDEDEEADDYDPGFMIRMTVMVKMMMMTTGMRVSIEM